MSDPEALIERLRGNSSMWSPIMREAADEIALLRAELHRVRQAHRSILNEVLYGGTDLCDEPDIDRIHPDIDRIHDFAKIGLKDMMSADEKTA